MKKKFAGRKSISAVLVMLVMSVATAIVAASNCQCAPDARLCLVHGAGDSSDPVLVVEYAGAIALLAALCYFTGVCVWELP
jgi:hypothetical protein